MPGTVVIFHNPGCSKSRATLGLLEEHDISLQIIEYLKIPLNKNIIEDILEKLGKEPRDIMRKNEMLYASNQLGNENLSDSKLIQAIIQNPILMERPIVLANNKAAIGRPPESVLKII